jgi:thiopeptide-type bacteriocin biosynthesis protein
VDAIARGVELLRRLAPPRATTELDAFREAFADRYGRQEVPLLEALDEELGVGFGGETDRPDPVPLLDGLRFPSRPGLGTTLGRREVRLLEILHRAWTEGAGEIALTADDVDALATDDAPPLPPAVGATAVLARTHEGLRVVVTGAGGPSGARLLGRFCHSDPELEHHVRTHLRAEEALDPGAVHAEIVHLPTGRLVNVLARPVLREYEIEWLGRSGAPGERVLPAADLLLSLRDGRFVLRSPRLGRRVVPRLTSAHNYNRRSPGVYRFLAALQSEGCVDGIGWSWSPFDRAPFTPRLRRGPIVLALARWRVAGPELRELDRRDQAGRWRAVAAWRERRRLPRWICLAEDDNVLAFDLDNVLSVDALVRAVRRREEALLEELFPGPDELVASAPDGQRALELVVPLVGTAPATGGPAAGTAAAPVRRTFPPGTEWTYLELFTGSATADRLLVEEVGPCARRLVASGAADRWFFLRYDDPGFHLRVRAHGDADRIRTAFEGLAARAIDQGLAHDARFATYQREVERYGGAEGIVVAERLFHADSEAVVDLLDLFDPGEAGLDARWRIGLLGADRLLRDLGLDDVRRAEAARRIRGAFEAEMRADARLRKGVAGRVRAERAALDDLLDASADGDHPLAPGVRVLAERSARIAPLAAELAASRAGGRLTTSIDALAAAFVHMWLNRLCRSESRGQEYVTYALLARLYEARAARSP